MKTRCDKHLAKAKVDLKLYGCYLLLHTKSFTIDSIKLYFLLHTIRVLLDRFYKTGITRCSTIARGELCNIVDQITFLFLFFVTNLNICFSSFLFL